ncbi:hypothetical protein RMSM_00283 [Rhodopirellula maiorica SM1]|uniref:Uncharacterized protein n=1 Tax=Rhodopirellula maiorica SM1 TaxID=1265738 RepID=M5RTZ3_9BACT|nr:hypothetical protein RMSM_00283 [Rhodopirellula maiorica SM1]
MPVFLWFRSERQQMLRGCGQAIRNARNVCDAQMKRKPWLAGC